MRNLNTKNISPKTFHANAYGSSYLISSISYSADETLEGSFFINDSHSGDFDVDLQINYNIETHYEGLGSNKVFTGFTGTFTGAVDGACNELKLYLTKSFAPMRL